ncbi:MAG: hypothetical protein WA476_01435, partial [Acidobacteriaceae bacterium]
MMRRILQVCFLPLVKNPQQQPFARKTSRPLSGAVVLILGLAAGCGGGGMTGTSGGGGPIPGESTLVTVVASSTANDQLTRFGMFLN